MSTNEQQNLLDKVSLLASEYKKNETQKILNIFHVTVLVIAALATEMSVKALPMAMLLVLLALIEVAFAYLFFYLADAHLATAQAYSYIKGSTGDLQPETEKKLQESIRYGAYCRNYCLGCAVFSYLFIFSAIYYAFNIWRLDWWFSLLPIVAILIIGYMAGKFYFAFIRIEK